ncbi:hypothetical protein [Streptomyces sp. UG1]|uniref:hypothetical protein n=1 Tax=Streptomyces sp. UG1 TaxID=3417652 RepID=UPI003CEC39E4
MTAAAAAAGAGTAPYSHSTPWASSRACPPGGRAARLAETLDALLMPWRRTAPEVAQALGIHPQLESLFGDRLGDPRFASRRCWRCAPMRWAGTG